MVMRVSGGRRHYRLVNQVIESERLVLVCRIGLFFCAGYGTALWAVGQVDESVL